MTKTQKRGFNKSRKNNKQGKKNTGKRGKRKISSKTKTKKKNNKKKIIELPARSMRAGADYTVTELDLSNQGLDRLPEDILRYTNLHILRCSNNKLTSFGQLPNTLQELYCQNNQLTSLDNLPNALQGLYCQNNQLTYLDDRLPKTLRELYCGNNQLTSLNKLPNTLEELWCEDNQLTSFNQFPNSLQVLWCDNNQLRSLENLPNTLLELSCDNNKLTSLDSLPETLLELYCANNQLTSLDKLPNTLQNLICSNNKITSINLPESLRILNYENTLIPLNNIPENLRAYNNPVSSLAPIAPVPVNHIVTTYDNVQKVNISTTNICINEESTFVDVIYDGKEKSVLEHLKTPGNVIFYFLNTFYGSDIDTLKYLCHIENFVKYVCHEVGTALHISNDKYVNTPYLNGSSFGCFCGLLPISKIKMIVDSTDINSTDNINCFHIIKIGDAPSTVSLDVLNGADVVSASHCQDGQGESINDIFSFTPLC
jgi:hypothetical protein